MFRGRLRWLVLGMALVLLACTAALWLLTPEPIDGRIHPGMTRAEVEAILGQADGGTEEYESIYYLPDGDFCVIYTQRNPELGRDKQVVFTRYRLGRNWKPSFWQRFRAWLSW